MNLKRTLRRTLDRLGVPYREERTGWRGSRRYGYQPIMSLVIDDADWPRVAADRESTRAARERRNQRARERRIAEREALAAELGLLPDSRTFAAYLRGEIDEDEAKRIGAITRWRHEETEYDALLARGIDRDTARAIIGQ